MGIRIRESPSIVIMESRLEHSLLISVFRAFCEYDPGHPPQPAAVVSNASTFASRSWATFKASELPYGARKLAILS